MRAFHLHRLLLNVFLPYSLGIEVFGNTTERPSVTYENISAPYLNQLTYNINISQWTTIELHGTISLRYTLTTNNIPTNVSFLLIEAHSFSENVTLASTNTSEFGTAVTSTDIGMTTLLKPLQTEVTWFLSLHSVVNLTIYVIITPYGQHDPVPGGCNQEFPLEYDPNLHLSNDPNIGFVAFQYSNVGFDRVPDQSQEPDCESQWDVLSYDVYLLYMTSSNPNSVEHFTSVKRMTEPNDIEKYGQKLLTIQRGVGERPRPQYMAYPGMGVVYNVIVTQTQGHLVRKSAYVASTSYSCNLASGLPDSCETIDDKSHPYKAIATAVACGGCLLMLFGHRFLKCNMFAFGFLSMSIVAYIVLRITVDISPMGTLWLGAIFGVLGGAVWIGCWWYFGIPVVSVLLVGLTAGYLFTSLVFYSPFDNISVFRQDFNYAMIFVCWMLVFNVLLLPWTKKLSIVSSSFVGSYSIVMAVGMYLKNGIPYVLLNSIRKAVIPGFIQVIPTKPFFTSDMILIITWVLLFLCSAVVQFYMTRHDLDFPPCPRRERAGDQRLFHLAEESANDDDRAPLLSRVRYPTYVDDVSNASHNRGFNNPNYGTYDASTSSGRRHDVINQASDVTFAK